MTTPDEEITGYGGQPKTGPGTTTNTTSTNATSGPTSSQPSSTGTGQNASGAAGHATEDAKAKARQAADQVKTQGKSQLEGYRETAADEIEKVAQGAKAAAQELEGQDRLGLSNYVSDMAQNMVQFSDSLRGKSVDELFQDVNRLARNNPALFITGSIALGFGLTRFARASSKRATQDEYGHRDSSTSFSSSSSQYGSSHEGHASDQSELNDRLSTGEPGTIGSISNAGVSSATSTSRAGTGVGTGSVTGPGTGLGSGSSGTGSGPGANTSNGLGIGTHSTSGVGSNTGRDGKGTDGGLFP